MSLVLCLNLLNKIHDNENMGDTFGEVSYSHFLIFPSFMPHMNVWDEVMETKMRNKVNLLMWNMKIGEVITL